MTRQERQNQAAARVAAVEKRANAEICATLLQAQRVLRDPAGGKNGYIPAARWAAKARARYRVYCKLQDLVWGYFGGVAFSTRFKVDADIYLQALAHGYAEARRIAQDRDPSLRVR